MFRCERNWASRTTFDSELSGCQANVRFFKLSLTGFLPEKTLETRRCETLAKFSDLRIEGFLIANVPFLIF